MKVRTFSAPDALWDEFVKQSEIEGESASSILRRLIREYLKRTRKGGKRS
ncbi:MAG TPA: hypothetical protein VNO43_02810 [Candidatus Eisenbacteria bacterium]|nr:hypothetical protein [Candidatus Eisenbacteria bacterium]